MKQALIPGDDSSAFPGGNPNQWSKGWDGHQTSALPNKLVTLSIGSADVLSAEIDIRGYRNLTFHFPSGTPVLGTIKSAPASGGTFTDLYVDDTLLTFTINGDARSTLKAAGQGFIKIGLDAAYGTDKTAYLVLS